MTAISKSSTLDTLETWLALSITATMARLTFIPKIKCPTVNMLSLFTQRKI